MTDLSSCTRSPFSKLEFLKLEERFWVQNKVNALGLHSMDGSTTVRTQHANENEEVPISAEVYATASPERTTFD